MLTFNQIHNLFQKAVLFFYLRNSFTKVMKYAAFKAFEIYLISYMFLSENSNKIHTKLS